MYTTGTGAKTAAIVFLFFMIIMIACFCSNIFRLITTVIFSGAGYAWQNQQVQTKYEHNCFHKAKIIV